MVGGNGRRQWSEAMVGGNGRRQWSEAMVGGNGRRQWSEAMVGGNGRRQWSEAMVGGIYQYILNRHIKTTCNHLNHFPELQFPSGDAVEGTASQ
jgi:hypothetical protein